MREEADRLAIHAIACIEAEDRTTDEVIHALRGWDPVAGLCTGTLSGFDKVLGQIRSIEGIVNSETRLLISSVLR